MTRIKIGQSAHLSLIETVDAAIEAHIANGLDRVEAIAVVAFVIGRQIAAVPAARGFTGSQLATMVAQNMAEGNGANKGVLQ